MFIHILWFAVGLIALIKGGDWFVDGAVGVAKKFHIPDLLIGATVVSIGTTLPEVLVSAESAAKGYGAMAYGNAIGSIICNTALVAAITIAIRPSEIKKKDMIIPVIFFFISAAFYAGTAYTTGNFTRITGIILLCIFVIYMIVVSGQAINDAKLEAQEVACGAVTDAAGLGTGKKPEAAGADKTNGGTADRTSDNTESPLWKNILFLVLGAVIIAIGADLLVDHGVAIAAGLGVPASVIAVTFVALGTSLPELVTAITSLAKGHSALSIGNICGANLFNLVLVSGIAITIGPFDFSGSDFGTLFLFGKEYLSSLLIETPLMIIVMIIMTVPALISGKLKRWQGVLLLCIYAAFCVYQFCG
ncbi:MAG: calcium/sodium antiporter [Lachnospiraceae bacterium]|nr:calcium/sodium antiporter [Candidatus Darwinimomas equi]